jgi:hypothetical protein
MVKSCTLENSVNKVSLLEEFPDDIRRTNREKVIAETYWQYEEEQQQKT